MAIKKLFKKDTPSDFQMANIEYLNVCGNKAEKESDAAIKIVKHATNTKYYARFNSGKRELFHPNKHKVHEISKITGNLIWTFNEVSEEFFNCYKQFLIDRKNQGYIKSKELAR